GRPLRVGLLGDGRAAPAPHARAALCELLRPGLGGGPPQRLHALPLRTHAGAGAGPGAGGAAPAPPTPRGGRPGVRVPPGPGRRARAAAPRSCPAGRGRRAVRHARPGRGPGEPPEADPRALSTREADAPAGRPGRPGPPARVALVRPAGVD